jgi:hypothetical protein
LYVSKSPLFFKKLYEGAKKEDPKENEANHEHKWRRDKCIIDINFVLEESKKRF